MELEKDFNIQESVSATLQKKSLEDNPYLEKVATEIKDQYMAGEYLLVAPLFTGEKSRQVVLPQGNWYDFYTGKYVGNGEIITVTPGLDRIPVFVKDGGIIPLFKQATLRTPGTDDVSDLEIRHYGKAEGTYHLYDDDGETYDYEQGEYVWREITVSYQNGKLTGRLSKPEKGKPNHIGKVTWVFMTK